MRVSLFSEGTDAMPKSDERRLTIRLTGEEYAVLLAKSGGHPLATFVRQLLLKRVSERRAKPVRTPLKDYVALAKVLAKLGTSPLVGSFRDAVADLGNGSLPTSDVAERSLEQIADELAEIRRLLMTALETPEQ